MGQKVSPYSFRLPLTKNWQSKWINKSNYLVNLQQDLQIRRFIFQKIGRLAAIEKIIIERSAKAVSINIYTAKPGILIGRSGQGVNELKNWIENKLQIVPGKIKINISEIRNPELSAVIMAQNIAIQIEKRVSYRRIVRQSLAKMGQAGAKGSKITLSGRLGGAEIARRESFGEGSIPLGSLKADIDFAKEDAQTTYGTVGVKVWIYKVKKELSKEEDVNTKKA